MFLNVIGSIGVTIVKVYHRFMSVMLYHPSYLPVYSVDLPSLLVLPSPILLIVVHVCMYVCVYSKKEREKAKIGLNWKFARRNQEVNCTYMLVCYLGQIISNLSTMCHKIRFVWYNIILPTRSLYH